MKLDILHRKSIQAIANVVSFNRAMFICLNIYILGILYFLTCIYDGVLLINFTWVIDYKTCFR